MKKSNEILLKQIRYNFLDRLGHYSLGLAPFGLGLAMDTIILGPR